jgi:ferric-dicitrate binding protein FerR (iron transport regulator)
VGNRRRQTREEVEGTDSWVRGVRSVSGKHGEAAMEAAHSGCGPFVVRCPAAKEGGVSCFEASR